MKQIDTEHAVGDFGADTVATMPQGGPIVVIENQLERPLTGIRGQVLTFLAGTDA